VISPRRPGATGYGWLAALTMTVLALSPLLAMFHQISSHHAVCEHGELVESGHGAFSPDDWRVGNAPVGRDADSAPASDARADSAAVRHGHSHCSVGTLAKNNIGVLPGVRIVTALSEIAVEELHPCGLAYRRPLLFSAPKTSPPRVAS